MKVGKAGLMICAVAGSLLLTQCKKEESPIPEDTFDKAGMLSNIGYNLILPSVEAMKNSVDSLSDLCVDFTDVPDISGLNELRNQLRIVYHRYQHISTFETGPGDAELVRASFNTFPCDTAEINTKIASGNYSLTTVADLDSKGLPALDYLLHGDGLTDQQVLDLFATHSSAANRRQYLSVIIGELKSKISNVRNGWVSSGGNYISSFVSNTGSDVGGSIGILVNQFNYDFELTKNARVGIPLGKKSMGVPLPEKSEALYAGYSISLVLEHLRNIEDIYLGRSVTGVNGPGLDDYLNHVGAQYGGGSLNDAILSRISSARSKLQAIPAPLSEAVLNHADAVDQAYADLQQLVVLFKVDMPSALGVLITYQDNDGD